MFPLTYCICSKCELFFIGTLRVSVLCLYLFKIYELTELLTLLYMYDLISIVYILCIDLEISTYEYITKKRI